MLVHANFAKSAGLLVDVAYRSPSDPYVKALEPGYDGWTHFFEPLRAPTGAALLQLDCWAAARAWESNGNYPHVASKEAVNGNWYNATLIHRRQRAELVRQLPIVPRRVYSEAARAFWNEHFATDTAVLGVHLRGTDKVVMSTRPVGVQSYMPLIRAYLCHEPRAALFVATDDARMLRDLRAALPSTKIVARDLPRSESSRNPVLDGGNQSAAATAGMDVLLDTLLLSRCHFLLKCASMVSEAATYFSPALIEDSYDFHVMGHHPKPTWIHACSRSKAAGAR